jgi:cytochrome c peroxidase
MAATGHRNRFSRSALAAVALVGAAACGGSSSGGSQGGTERVALHFLSLVGGSAFACGQTYPDIGVTRVTIEPTDLRFFVSNPRLIDDRGEEVPIELDQDGRWQLEDLALLDFEDANGRCERGGDPETNTAVRGTVPAGTYEGVRFTIGVPFERNHQDAASASPPLHLAAMFRSREAGYRFLRFDSAVVGGLVDFRFQVGSTECTGDGSGVITSCANPNRIEVELLDFDPSQDAIAAEFATLLADTAVQQNAGATPPGCMGGPTDPDCDAPFSRLGLPFAGRPAGEQQVFYVAAGAGSGPLEPLPSPTPGVPTEFVWNLPEGFPRPPVPDDNPMSAAKVQLGRHLFYDRRLSLNETQSCGSCHQQSLAFTDELPVSIGSTDESHPRNSQTLTNVAYNPTLTWMSPHLTRLEDQLLVPLLGDEPVELGFGGNEDVLLARLHGEPLYQDLFAEAFPGEADPITVDNLAKAIASFQRILISGRSPFDRFVFQGDEDALSPGAKRGMQVFFSDVFACDTCHGGLNFASSLTIDGFPNDPAPFENNGQYNVGGTGDYPEPNTGLFASTGNPDDMGRMKPPTLRNVELTAPYMHDGSVATLEEVLDNYARGGRLIESGPLAGDGADNPFKNELVAGFPISDQARSDMVEFLKSLTDREFVNDPRLSDPFATE